MNCPICQAESFKFYDSFKCLNNHIWHLCKVHNTPVVTSLIGELPVLQDSVCTCGLNCLSPSQMKDISTKLVTTNIQIQSNTTNFNKKYLEKIEASNNAIKKELEKENVLIAAPIKRPKVEKKDDKIVKKEKKPNKLNMPLNISEKGKKHWKAFCDSYSKIWKQYDDVNRQWATAVAIWRNWAVKRNIPPFNESPESIDQSTVEYMAKRIISSLEKVYTSSEKLIQKLVKQKFCKKALVMSLSDVSEASPGKWKITFSQKINGCTAFNDKDFIAFMKKQKFYRTNKVFKLEVSPNNYLILRDGKETYLDSQFIFTNQLIKIGLKLSDSDIKNKELVKKALVKFFKSKLREIRRG